MKDQESNEDEDEGSRTITELFSSSDEDTDSENDEEIFNTVKKLDQIHAQKKIKGKRNRLKPHQTQKMINYFYDNPVWNYEIKVRIAKKMNMTLAQVAKWHWDYRKKNGLNKKI